MNIVIETHRLFLRQFSEDDASLLYELNRDPEVTKYTRDPMRDEEHARQVLEQIIIPQYVLYQHGRWAVHRKQGLEFIGWCGLKFIPALNEIDLGYRFLKKEWSKGYATEAAAACIKYGFEKLGLRTITGRADPANTSSIKVLENCGMVYIGDQHMDGDLTKCYQLNNPFIN